MKNNLLYLNLAIDKKDTSLGFASSWIEEISKIYNKIDVVTLRLGEIPELPKNVNIYGPITSKNKLQKYIYLYKKINNLTKANNYSRCFSHMSGISLFIVSGLLNKNKIKSTLWFTHPGPSFGLKKFILYSAYKFSENIVTASKSSFPFSSNKVSVIGHAIDTKNFKNTKNEYKIHNFLILSRISRSKNIEISINAFLKSNFKDKNLDIIGGPLNSDDKDYFDTISKKYLHYENINFLGKINHNQLPMRIADYDVSFNSAGDGFFDKSVLETLSCGILNFYHNKDFDDIYESYAEKFYFNNEVELTNKINALSFMTNKDIETFFYEINHNLDNHSLNSLTERLKPFF
jgi:glycosyltransferase involved in cell wall biosynthesis